MRKELIRAIQFALVILGVSGFLYPTSPGNMPLTFQDSGVYLYIGSHVLQGQVPYRDIWENKPPVVFYLDALGLGIANGSRWGVWVIEVLAISIASLTSYKLLSDAFGRLAGLVGTCVWLLSLVYVVQGGNLTEEYALPLQFGCLWLAYDSEKRGAYGWRGLWIGILLGIAFFTKHTLIGVGFAIFLYIILSRLLSRQPSRILLDLAPIFLGGLGIIAIVVLFFARQSALPEFWDNVFLYNFAYAQLNDVPGRIESIIKGLDYLSKTGLTTLALIGWVCGFAYLGSSRMSQNRKWAILVGIGLIELPIELVMAGLPGNSYGHYYMTLLPVFAIFAGFIIAILEAGLTSLIAPSSQRAWVLPTLIFIAFVLAETLAVNDFFASIEAMRNIKNNHIVEYVQNNTAPGECVLMWGLETRVNFLANRCSPTRYTYQSFPLHTPGYTSVERVEEFLRDLERMKPKLIIDTKENGFFIGETGFSSPEIERLLKFVDANYKVRDQIGSWVVYAYGGP